MKIGTYLFLKKVVLNRNAPSELQSEALDLLLSDKLEGQQVDIAYACRQLGISPEQHKRVQHFAGHSESKIAAIRELRSFNQYGLKDAKDAVENPLFFVQPVR